jgi:hypothetical protein
LTINEWKVLLRWFVRGLSSDQIARETGLERKRVLRALTIVRRAVAANGQPHANHARNNSHAQIPVFGLSTAHGHAVAEMIAEPDAEEIRHAVRGRKPLMDVKWTRSSPYAAVVYRGRFYRLTDASDGQWTFGDLEAFWSYLQQRLRSKGGIRRDRVVLYVAEYTWRYNNRTRSPAEQARLLLALVRRSLRRGTKRDFAAVQKSTRSTQRDLAADR